jgi:gliding motility-associated-like protein
VTDINGCSGTSSIDVEIVPLPQLNISSGSNNNVVCENFNLSLFASGAVTYNWSGPGGFSSSNATSTIVNASAVNEGWYFITGTDINGCQNIDSLSIQVITDFTAIASVGDSVICPGEPISLSVNQASSYLWVGPFNFSSSFQSPVISNSQISNTGWYQVSITDENGCQASDSVYVLVANNSDCLLIPTLFTPDGDPHNQNWVINGIENFEKAEVEIYNRWGNMVYYASPYNNDWDGMVNKGTTIDGNGKVPVGTYFFIIRLNDPENKEFKGYVEVQY